MSSLTRRRRRERLALSGPVLVDFESRSRAKLKGKGAVSGRKYWEHESTEAICAVLYDVRRDEWHTWAPGEEPPRLGLAVAHNALGFDRFAATACGWRVDAWQDSSSAARRAGLPGKLDQLGQRWLGRRKDTEGNKVTLALSRPSRAKATRGEIPPLTREVVERVLTYCADDVEIMAETWDGLRPWLDVDAETCAVDAVINDRGIYLDVELVQALQRQFQTQQEKAIGKAAKRLGWNAERTRKAAMSWQQFVEATGLPNAQKETIAADTTGHPLVAVRKALASVVPGKLTAALATVSEDNRLRDMIYYYGAHTGRWSGRYLQPHNLNRISFEEDAKRIGWHVDDYISALIDGALTGEDLTKHQVSGVLRSVLTAAPGRELAVLDYAGIEARGLAWAAGDTKALDVFKALDAGTGPDPYKVMAGQYLFGVDVAAVTKEQRGLGKIAELMLGYGAGADKFRESCEKGGANLDALGVSAEDVVHTYRNEAHPAIAALWKACEKAFVAASHGRSVRAGKWVYEAHNAADGSGGVDVWCVLPSGRPIVYPNVRAKRGQRRAKNGRTFQAWDISYQGRRFREHVYGGLLVENGVQAFCRDLLADALVRCEEAGLDPVLHVHDENVCEVDDGLGAEALDEMRDIMGTKAPRWSRGLPIRLDGFHSRRYRK